MSTGGGLLWLFMTPTGRCKLRQVLLDPVAPVAWRAAAARRRRWPASHALVAVTGSFGKTTTARAVRCALGLPVGDGAGANSGHAAARAFLLEPPDAAHSVFEVGIRAPGQMAPRARAYRPDVAVVTSIGSEHRSSMGTLERTREEKFELVRALAPGGAAVLNGDDPHVRWMIPRAPGRVVTFGTGEANDVRAESATLDWPRGTRVVVRVGAWRGGATVRLIGDHSVLAVLAAVSVAWVAGVDPAVALERASRMAPTPGRMQPVPLPNGAWLLRDEYKSNVETIDRALEVLAQVPARSRIAVLGGITEPDHPVREQYRLLGERAARAADRAIIVGAHAHSVRQGLVRGGVDPERIVEVKRDWREACAALEAMLEPGDAVLLKGRQDERLERIALALAGRTVRCELRSCVTPLCRCDGCPML